MTSLRTKQEPSDEEKARVHVLPIRLTNNKYLPKHAPLNGNFEDGVGL